MLAELYGILNLFLMRSIAIHVGADLLPVLVMVISLWYVVLSLHVVSATLDPCIGSTPVTYWVTTDVYGYE